MKVRGLTNRIRPEYTNQIGIPQGFKKYFWDCPDGKTYLEKFILRILTYGSFKEIKWIYERYPKETYNIAFKYPEIKRGVKFWIKLWKKKSRE